MGGNPPAAKRLCLRPEHLIVFGHLYFYEKLEQMEKPDGPLAGINLKTTIESLVKIGLVVLLLVYSFYLLKPFVVFFLWGMNITVTLFPLYAWQKRRKGIKKGLAASIVTLLLLNVILVPLVFLGESLASGIEYLIDLAQAEGFAIPPPDDSVKEWPLIGDQLHAFWLRASTNLEDVIVQYSPQIQKGLLWFVSALANVGTGFVLFILSIVVAGFFLAYSGSGGKTIRLIAYRLIGRKSAEYLDMTQHTIRNVALGIIGVPMLQSVLAGLGFLVAGVPAAGLWALLAFLLGIIQIGIGPIVIPVLIYVFFEESLLTFILLTIWSAPLFILDNILKPFIFGRHSRVPMLVVFIGSIGGFMLSGIIGLFVGAVILSLGYRFLQAWLQETDQT